MEEVNVHSCIKKYVIPVCVTVAQCIVCAPVCVKVKSKKRSAHGSM